MHLATHLSMHIQGMSYNTISRLDVPNNCIKAAYSKSRDWPLA